MDFCFLKTRELWGDYGSLLITGMTGHLDRKDGLLQLERTGPFVPPMTLPSLDDVVVTDAFRKELESSPIGPFEFRPVLKTHIVQSDWETWDLLQDEPGNAMLGDPEEYILERPHSPEVAQQMGPMWEVVLPTGAEIEIVKPGPSGYEIVGNTWTGAHLFLAKNPAVPDPFGYWIVTSTVGKQWLEKHGGDWLRFEPVACRE